MTEPTWTVTRSQLTDALANIEVRVSLTGAAARKVNAESMADAILSQLPQADAAMVTVRRTAVESALRALDSALAVTTQGPELILLPSARMHLDGALAAAGEAEA